MQAKEGTELYPYSFITPALDWAVVTISPTFYPRQRTPVPFVQEAGWAPGPVWTGVEKVSCLTGFKHRTVQPAASLYNDYAIPDPKQ